MLVDDFWALGLDKLFHGNPPHVVRLPFPIGVKWGHASWSFGMDALARKICPIIERRQDGTYAVDATWAAAPYPSLIFFHSPKEQALLCLQDLGTKDGATWWGVDLVVNHERLTVFSSLCGLTDVMFLGHDAALFEETSFKSTALVSGEAHAHRFRQTYRQNASLVTMPGAPAVPSVFWDVPRLAVTACALMNARNVRDTPVTPAPALQRRRQQRGQRPLFTYHELRLLPFRALRQAALTAQEGETLPIHWVRGHFKVFSPARPLFGKYHGRFWWQPHLAGRDHERVVEKSYLIERLP